MRIIWVIPPTIPFKDAEATIVSGQGEIFQTIAPPLGVLSLAAAVGRMDGVRQSALDYLLPLKDLRKGQYESVDAYILDLAKKSAAPDVVCFSVQFSSSLKFNLRALELLKGLWPSAKFVCGGNLATSAHAYLQPRFNAVFAGESEEIFPRWLKSGTPDGLYICENNIDVNLTPPPDWSLLSDEYTIVKGRRKNIAGITDRQISVLRSRGCSYRCTYCAGHQVLGRKRRVKTTENIINEIKGHYSNGIRCFIFEDDLLLHNEPEDHVFLKRLSTEFSDIEIQTPSALHVNTLTEEIVQLLVDCGMKTAVIAVESGCPATQKKVKKVVDLDKALEVVGWFKKRNLAVRVYLMFGFPGEQYDEMQQTVDFARKLHAHGADWCNFIIATPLYGSDIYKQFVESGSFADDYFLQADNYYQVREFDDVQGLKKEELNRFYYEANLSVNFLSNSNFVTGQYEKAVIIFKDMLENYPFHIFAKKMIANSYRKLAEKNELELTGMIATDPRAKEMREQYARIFDEACRL